MKRFILIGIVMLVFAVVVTILVWYLVQGNISIDEVTGFAPEQESMTGSSKEETQTAENEEPPITESILLRDLPLSDGQRSMLKTAGIDVETFVITPEMVTCAQQKLGSARFEEIIEGSAPTFMESTRLLGCIQ